MLCSQYYIDNQRTIMYFFENIPYYINRISHNMDCELILK